MNGSLIITGVDGFVGRHVARLAAQSGISVIGTSRARQPDASIASFLDDYAAADLREGWPEMLPPEAPVVHLAGLAAVGPSFDAPQEYISGNSAMVTAMCESRLTARSSARIVAVSTGAVYATDVDDAVHHETGRVGFNSPYVVSKILVENQIAYYRSRGLAAVIARPFNHIGPGQGLGFLVPDLLHRLRSRENGGAITVGDLSSRRDYTDVRDVARAYIALAFAETLPHDVYNVATGTSHSGQELLALLCAELGQPLPDLEVDPARLRPNDPRSIAGDATRLRETVGWEPRISLAQTIRDVVHNGPDGDSA